MKHTLSVVKMLVPVLVISLVTLAPAAAPIITPRATLRTIFACQSLAMGTVVVTDARGHNYAQTCGASLKTALGYPGLYPTEDAPWQVTILVQPASLRWEWPQICHTQITGVPLHVECATISLAPVTVDFDMILTLDSGGM